MVTTTAGAHAERTMPAKASKGTGGKVAAKLGTKSKKTRSYKIHVMDGSDVDVQTEKHAMGKELFEKFTQTINLLEKDYFGLTYYDAAGNKDWLQWDKKLLKQLRDPPCELFFEVKFYPPEPELLQEDITRYYLCLQVRNDVVSGKLACTPLTHALLGSYLVQAQIGDYEEVTNGQPENYLAELKFSPTNSPDLMNKVHELHKAHKGQTPSEAEAHYLENAKKLALYGVTLYNAKDTENVQVGLAVCSSGLLVYRDKLRINRFVWPKIVEILYKSNFFYVKIMPGEFEQRETIVGFKFQNSKAAKKFWKTCVENHSFFRLVSPEALPKRKLLGLGSSRFRFSGRTLYQSRLASGLIHRHEPAFQRSVSSRVVKKTEATAAKPKHHGDYKPAESSSPMKYADTSSKEAFLSSAHSPKRSISPTAHLLLYTKSPEDIFTFDTSHELSSCVEASFSQPNYNVEKMSPSHHTESGVKKEQVEMECKVTDKEQHEIECKVVAVESDPKKHRELEKKRKKEEEMKAKEEKARLTKEKEIAKKREKEKSKKLQKMPLMGEKLSVLVDQVQPEVSKNFVVSPTSDQKSQNQNSPKINPNLRDLTTEVTRLDQSALDESASHMNGEEQVFRSSQVSPQKPAAHTVTTVVTDEESIQNVPEHVTTVKTTDGSYTTTTTASQVKTVKQTIQTKSSETFSVPASILNGSPEKFLHHVVNGNDANFSSSGISSVIPPDAKLISRSLTTEDEKTVEILTYQVERNGAIETHTEQKVTINPSSDIDHDKQLSAAILEATMMNPNVTVDKVEVRRTGQTDL